MDNKFDLFELERQPYVSKDYRKLSKPSDFELYDWADRERKFQATTGGAVVTPAPADL